MVCENRVGLEGQVTYREGMVKNCNTPLSPIMRSLLIKVRQGGAQVGGHVGVEPRVQLGLHWWW